MSQSTLITLNVSKPYIDAATLRKRTPDWLVTTFTLKDGVRSSQTKRYSSEEAALAAR